jgi:hypothetical protein
MTRRMPVCPPRFALGLVLVAPFAVACTSSSRAHLPPPAESAPARWQSQQDIGHPLVGVIVDVAAHRRVSEAELTARVRAADIVLVGETHDNPDHHRLEAALVQAFSTTHPAAVVFEMLNRQQQPSRGARPCAGADVRARRASARRVSGLHAPRDEPREPPAKGSAGRVRFSSRLDRTNGRRPRPRGLGSERRAPQSGECGPASTMPHHSPRGTKPSARPVRQRRRSCGARLVHRGPGVVVRQWRELDGGRGDERLRRRAAGAVRCTARENLRQPGAWRR